MYSCANHDGVSLARPTLLSGNHVNQPFNMYLCFCTCVFVLYITYRWRLEISELIHLLHNLVKCQASIDGRIGVSVAHWNIHGLADKLDDDNFTDSVNKFDVCFLTETWKEGIVIMSGKIVIRKDAKKIVNKRGRKSGGILALIDTEIKKGITIVENNNEYGIWLRLHKNYFMTENDIYLCGI